MFPRLNLEIVDWLCIGCRTIWTIVVRAGQDELTVVCEECNSITQITRHE